MRQNDSGLNFAGTTTVPPVANVARVEATKPCTWKSRHHHSDTSSGTECECLRAMFRAEIDRFECKSGTRSGRTRAAAGVQDQGHIVDARGLESLPGRRPDRLTTPVSFMVTVKTGTRFPAARRAWSSPSAGTRNSGVRVPEVKVELIFLICGVERRSRTGHRRRQETTMVGNPFGRAMPTRVSSANAGSRERVGDCFNRAAQLAISDTNVRLGENHRCPAGWNCCEKAQ